MVLGRWPVGVLEGGGPEEYGALGGAVAVADEVAFAEELDGLAEGGVGGGGLDHRVGEDLERVGVEEVGERAIGVGGGASTV